LVLLPEVKHGHGWGYSSYERAQRSKSPGTNERVVRCTVEKREGAKGE
jgi:hypothetical protein